MIDKPLYIAIEITRNCNLNCIHCFEKNSLNMAEEVDDKTILSYIQQIKTIEPVSLCICGGEPALKLPLVEKILCNLSDSNIEISMVTNGTILSKDDYRRLKEKGLDLIQVSLDGAKEDTHDFIRRKNGCFKRVLKAIDDALEVGLAVSLSFTCMKYNIDEFADYCKLVEAYVDKDISVVVSPIIKLGNALKDNKMDVKWNSYRKIVMMINEKNKRWGKEIFKWSDPLESYGDFSKDDIKNSQLYINNTGQVVINPYIEETFFSLSEYTLIDAWKKRKAYYLDVQRKMDISIYELRMTKG